MNFNKINFNKMNKDDLVKELEKHYNTNGADCVTVTHSRDCAECFSTLLKYSKKECFMVLYIDGANSVIGTEILSKKGFNSESVNERDLFRNAIKYNCASIVIGHNKKGKVCDPTAEDMKLTQKLFNTSELVGIEILDHVILFDEGHYSFHGNGKLR